MRRQREGWFGWWARTVLGNQRAFITVLMMIVGLAAVLGLPPKVNSDLLALLPDGEPTIIALRELHEAEGGVNLVTLAFDSEDPDELDAYLKALSADLADSERVEWALYEVDPDIATRLGLLQLAREDVQQLAVRMKGALAMGPALNPLVSSKLMAMGPLTERVRDTASAGQVLGASDGGRVLLRPTESAHVQSFAIALVDEIEAAIARHQQSHPGVHLQWFGGAYRHNVEDVRGIQSDLFSTAGASALLVLLVVALAFRSWRATLLVFVPLIGASLCNLAIAHVWVGHLTTYTAFCSAILFGLGIDFAVHLVGRYREHRAAGVAIEESVITAWDQTGPPCLTAALTSAAGFLALAVADFRGFSQLGWLLALGLLVCLFAMVTVLPLLLVRLDREPVPLPGADAEFVSVSDYRFAVPGLAVLLLLTAVVGTTIAPRLQWEFDFSALRRDGLAYAELTELERDLARESYSPLIVDLSSEDALRKAQAHADKEVAAERWPHVRAAVSIASVLPEDQEQRLDALRTLQGTLTHPNLRYLPAELVKNLLPLRDLDLSSTEARDLPIALQDILGVAGGHHRLLLFPQGNMWDLREASALKQEMTDAFEKPVAGEYLALGALYEVVQRDMPWVALAAMLAISLLTALDLRRAHWVVGALVTLLAGMVWSATLSHLAGVKLSIINIVGVPILLGIGVDMVIHLLHRLREEGPGGIRRALATTGVASLVSTLTTIMSFASLTLAGSRAIRSLGMLVVIGLFAIFLTTATLLPLVWSAGWRLTGRAPSEQGSK